jgi:transmembrane protein EpsG
MIVYLSVLLVILISGEAYKVSANKCRHSELPEGDRGRKRYIVLVSALLALQSGLRHWAVGADTYNYYESHFEPTMTRTWSDIFRSVYVYLAEGQGKDPGYAVIEKLTQYITPHYQLFLLLIAVAFFAALGRFIYIHTTTVSDAELAFVLYYTLFFDFFSLTGHRQTIATAITLFAYELVTRRRALLFFPIILVASVIHKSVLGYMILYFVAPIKNAKWFGLGVLISVPVVFLYGRPLADMFMRLSGYNYEAGEAAAYKFTFLLVLFDVVALWRMQAVLRQDPEARSVYNAFSVAVLLSPLIWSLTILIRLVQYFSIFMLLLLPKVVNSFPSKSTYERQAVYYLCIAILLVLGINAHLDMEYAFFWQQMELPEHYY